jgi:hypothetical protein
MAPGAAEMTILSRLQEKRGDRMPDPFAPRLIAEVKQTGNYKPYETSFNTEFRLTVTVEVTFWADQAQYAMAREVAEKILAETMFKDIIISAHKAMSAASAGNRNGVMQACADILRECEP